MAILSAEAGCSDEADVATERVITLAVSRSGLEAKTAKSSSSDNVLRVDSPDKKLLIAPKAEHELGASKTNTASRISIAFFANCNVRIFIM